MEKPVDTTVKIFEYMYLCSIPWLKSQPIEMLKRYGVTLSGNANYDSDIENQWFTIYLTIAQMTDLMKDGVSVKVINVKDTKEIYESISHHLYAWKQQLHHGINIGGAPIDDLIALDELANKVYAHAKHQFTRGMADSIMARYLNEVQHLNASNFFRPEALKRLAPNVTSEDGITRINAETEDPQRETLADFFKDKMINIKRY